MDEKIETELGDPQVGEFVTIQVPTLSREKRLFRSSIKNRNDALKWVEEYGVLTRSQWIVKQTYPNAERVQYHCKWICALSPKNKMEDSQRNSGCTVTMDVKIKLNTVDSRKKDQYLRRDEPLLGVIYVHGLHNHFRNCAINLKYMRGTTDLRETFFSYFHDGSSAAEAIRLHEEKLMYQENGLELLADAHHNPSSNTVYYWHKIWRTLNFGPVGAPLEVLKEKCMQYKNQGVTVAVDEQAASWSVLVVTPVMKRAQEYHSAANIIFVDTSSSCDSTNSNVTILTTGTSAGAVPIAVLIHERQTSESYRLAFDLLQTTFPHPFGGKDSPYVFMTDNSDAEKSALRSVWATTVQLLCDFHVAQNEWRWLFAAENEIPKNKRRSMMSSFQKLVYSLSAEELEENIQALKDEYPEYYEARVKRLLEQKEEWVHLFRSELPIGGHHTNNFSEATIRVLKDVILNRVKAFNIVSLVDYIANVWENYLTARLAKFAYDRKSAPHLLYNDLVKRMPSEAKEKIVKVDQDTFLVPDSKSGECTYEVIVSAGMCNCKAGMCGAFCKHQALVHSVFGGLFPNCPPVTQRDRHQIGKLAMGEKCPPMTFFSQLTVTTEDFLHSDRYEELPVTEVISSNSPTTNLPLSCDSDENIPLPQDIDDVIQKFNEKLAKLHSFGLETDPKTYLKYVKRASDAMDKVLNHNTAVGTMMAVSAAVKGTVARFGKKIHVQPTAIQRRQNHPSKGSKRVPAGRPSGKESLRRVKRPRKLAASIQKNIQHIRKH